MFDIHQFEFQIINSNSKLCISLTDDCNVSQKRWWWSRSFHKFCINRSVIRMMPSLLVNTNTLNTTWMTSNTNKNVAYWRGTRERNIIGGELLCSADGGWFLFMICDMCVCSAFEWCQLPNDVFTLRLQPCSVNDEHRNHIQGGNVQLRTRRRPNIFLCTKKRENEHWTTYRRDHAVRFANGPTASEERYQKYDRANDNQCDWRHIDFGFFERV